MSAINPNLNLPRRGALALLLAATCAVDGHAAAGPHGPPGPPGPPPAPSTEELATVPSLSGEQQVQLHRILVERRDAHEALAKRSRDALDAQRKKDRAEHERIDEQSTDRVRKLLGEDGFRRYAEWQQSHRGSRRGHGGADHGEDPHERANGMEGDRPPPDGRRPQPGAAGLATPSAAVDDRS